MVDARFEVGLEVFEHARREAQGRGGFVEPGVVVVAEGFIKGRVGPGVVGIDEGENETERFGLGIGDSIFQESDGFAEIAFVVKGSGILGVDSAIGAIPAVETVAGKVVMIIGIVCASGPVAHVPFSFIDDIVAGGLEDGGEIRKGGVELGFSIGLREIFGEGLEGTVLGGEEAGEKGVAGGGALAATGVGVGEGDAVGGQSVHGRKIGVAPAGGEPLESAFLVGEENEQIHPVGGRRHLR